MQLITLLTGSFIYIYMCNLPLYYMLVVYMIIHCFQYCFKNLLLQSQTTTPHFNTTFKKIK